MQQNDFNATSADAEVVENDIVTSEVSATITEETVTTESVETAAVEAAPVVDTPVEAALERTTLVETTPPVETVAAVEATTTANDDLKAQAEALKAELEALKAQMSEAAAAPTKTAIKKAKKAAKAAARAEEAAKVGGANATEANTEGEEKSEDETLRFDQLGLLPEVLRAVTDAGYETPSPIQAQSIPVLLEGCDILGQAKTGTGKTAAFALPMLSKVDLNDRDVQAFVLTPTRELAVQVAANIEKYAQHIHGLRVVSVYGGQSIVPQLQALRRGAHIVVGTPGRVLDHLNRGTLKLEKIRYIVLDEADEMLRMGFIDDVEEILKHTSEEKQVALFSATMPEPIRRIAHTYLNEPVEVRIKSKTATAQLIEQKLVMIKRMKKSEAFLRILEAIDRDATLVFVRTKAATLEIATALQKRGYQAIALNGDMKQNERERAVEMLKDGRIDIVVATDVAARGLDVERISLVINYDTPFDRETYVHRIGRTGRAGRKGVALMLATHRDMRAVRNIERHTRQPMEKMAIPTAKEITTKRVDDFQKKVLSQLDAKEGNEKHEKFCDAIVDHLKLGGLDDTDLMRALVRLAVADKELRYVDPVEERPQGKGDSRTLDKDRAKYRIAIGREHGVTPGKIVGAIANEVGIPGAQIGPIRVREDHSFVGLPADMAPEVLRVLQKVTIDGLKLRITKDDGKDFGPRSGGKFSKGGKFGRGGKFNKGGKFGKGSKFRGRARSGDRDRGEGGFHGGGGKFEGSKFEGRGKFKGKKGKKARRA